MPSWPGVHATEWSSRTTTADGYRFLKDGGAAGAVAERPAPTDAQAPETRPRRVIRCAACDSPVAWPEQAIEVQGTHRHQCTNPHGLSFVIACYRRAAGCGPIGQATTEWSWFRGFAWRIGLCRGCGAHLGWRYDAQDVEPFFGLIVDRLRYPGPSGD